MATDINSLDPNVTMARLRSLVYDGNQVAKVEELSFVELIDMLFAAASLIRAVGEVFPVVHSLLESDFSGVGKGRR